MVGFWRYSCFWSRSLCRNKDSLDWPERVGVKMTTLSVMEWTNIVSEAGFEVLQVFKANSSESFLGTLSIIARA